KNTTFNGIRLPNLMLLDHKNELQMIREFSYKDYSLRN
ncbi:hypothetical protein ACLJ4X_000566, partial [Campylobacter coli]